MTQGLECKNMCIFAGTVVQSKKYPNGFALTHTPQGTPKLEVNLFIERNFTDNRGQQKSNKAYIDVVVWGQRAQDAVSQLYLGAFVEVVCEYSKKYVKERNATYHTFTANKIEVKGGMPQQPQQYIQPPQQPVQPPSAYPAQPGPTYNPTPQYPQSVSNGITQQTYTTVPPMAPPQQNVAMQAQPPVQPVAPPPMAPPPPMNTPVQVPVQMAPPQASMQGPDEDIPF